MAKTKGKYNFKGLDDIFGESVSDIIGGIENDKEKVNKSKTMISIDLLKPNPFQPRKTFEEEELNELAESIKIHGIIQPIIINNQNEIVAGERRTRAAKIAGLKEIPAIILELSSDQMEEFAIIENIQRVDLLDIEEAVAYKKLSTNLKLKQEEIAIRVGKSRSHVANIMRLLNLPQKVQDAMLQRKVTMGQAKPLLSIINNEQLLDSIFKKILEQDLTARAIEQLIKNNNSNETEKLNVPKNPAVIYTENKIMRRLGTKVTIDSGKLTIRFSSDDDLNRILELLGLTDED
ncbi:ParB/RepB/Spo0J family partition protein [Spiroplasma floricola]|uniref:Chromosome partitioning protein ParB n=1 Tax=Spiroplasma floricola 23-6 TaxID=1336749 RepID=A0A2K8SFA5_9MOLU|nr:ParB/RepB/Spo0J family partition protein [Spiroplasma floricola]AUB32157.1 chromosome partitioning protein ParB [Spiroplasma floricola 23-6]